MDEKIYNQEIQEIYEDYKKSNNKVDLYNKFLKNTRDRDNLFEK